MATSADTRLQVKAKQGNDRCNRPAVRDERVVRCGSQCRKADKTGVVAQGNSEFGFARRLSRWAADAGDLEECARLALVTDIGGQRQYRFKQAHVADRELRRVDANR